ncbi:hypothetical protein LUU34_00597800 [Aix galericulata]|nr:hypothetical protein LUU34_00597800 [Aix galericulata]
MIKQRKGVPLKSKQEVPNMQAVAQQTGLAKGLIHTEIQATWESKEIIPPLWLTYRTSEVFNSIRKESPDEQLRHPFGIVGSSSQLVTVPGSGLSADPPRSGSGLDIGNKTEEECVEASQCNAGPSSIKTASHTENKTTATHTLLAA